MSIWTIAPETDKYDLTFVGPDGKSHPFWIRVKRHLTVGEERRVLTAGWKSLTRGESGENEIQINWRQQTFARTEVYLTDWSLTEDDGSRIPLDRAAIESLHPAVFKIIEQAINAHVEAMAEEKKVTTGSGAPAATSD